MAKSVEKVYGRALYDAAKESDRYDLIYNDAIEVKDLFKNENGLLDALSNPQVTEEEKSEMLDKIFLDNAQREIVEVLRIMIKNGRQKDIIKTLTYFIDLVKDEKKIGVVYVTSADDLTDEQMEAIEAKILNTTDYENLEMVYQVDEEILGGLIIRIKDRVIDSTLKSKLEKISRELSKITLDSKMID